MTKFFKVLYVFFYGILSQFICAKFHSKNLPAQTLCLEGLVISVGSLISVGSVSIVNNVGCVRSVGSVNSVESVSSVKFE